MSILAAPAFADGSFVKIGDINGGATEAQHNGWIQVGLWGTDTRSGRWFWSKPTNVFWFEMAGKQAALEKAVQNKTFYERVLFDVSIRGETLRTTFSNVRVIAVEPKGKVGKITLQYKRQTDQRVTFTAAR
jgi:type VI protein secretion system component Hcp